MKEFLLSNNWIFSAFGVCIMLLLIWLKDSWVRTNSKIEDIAVWYTLIIIVYGSVSLWTDFFTWLLK